MSVFDPYFVLHWWLGSKNPHQGGTSSPCGWNKRASKDSGQIHPAKKIKLGGGKPTDSGKVAIII